MPRSLPLLALALAAVAVPGASAQEEKPLYLDTSRSFDERAADLVSRMTLEEKVSQMVHDAAAIPRLGVPQYDWWNECLHGVARAGRATVFPQAIGLASTFDTDLIHRVGTAISDEARAKHHASARAGRRDRYRGLTFWSPNINIFRDPRWGRGQETYGEDPFLTATIGTAFVKGLQGDDPRYLKVAAGAKHFAVHSGPEGERHVFDARVSPKDMHETYLPAFEALVKAGVETVMCAYNRVDGAPACGSPFLLQHMLRETWGFDGHVVSDCWAIRDFDENHEVTKDNAESAALALKTGTNLNCGNSYPSLTEAVKRGLVTEAEIDAALADLMRTRFRLGLFDPEEDVPYTRIGPEVIASKEHRALAREAALESLVLLKNEGGLLPIDKSVAKVYVNGPLAADAAVLLGNYSGVSSDLATILEGVVEKVGPATTVSYRQGSLLDRENINPIDWYSGVAADADVTIAVMGISNLLEGEEGAALASPGKGDRFETRLPENQLSFLRKIREQAPKLVVVLLGGSPMAIPEVHELADAVLLAWYPGEEGGRAVADVLFGDASPSGRLPITFPVSLDQLPPYEDYAMAGRSYRYMEQEPLYPFGFGLGYARFEYGALELPESVPAGEPVQVKVRVKNTSATAGEEVVQVYVRDVEASTTTPLSSLAAFERVALGPGESRVVALEVAPERLELVLDSGERVLEKGDFEITVGGASPGARAVALGAPTPVVGRFAVR
jgi:beta-glucosidase